MDFPIKLHTISSGWSIVCIEGSQVIIPQPQKIYRISFSEDLIDFVLANSADPDEMQHHAAFHMGIHCLPKYPFKDF